MWDIHRNIDFEHFNSNDKYTVRFDFSGTPRAISRWWIVIENKSVDVCMKNPGHEINLKIDTHIKTMTEIWMGWLKLSTAKRNGLIVFEGMARDIKFFHKWFKLNVFAHRPQL